MRVLEVPRGDSWVRVHEVSRQGSLATVRPVLMASAPPWELDLDTAPHKLPVQKGAQPPLSLDATVGCYVELSIEQTTASSAVFAEQQPGFDEGKPQQVQPDGGQEHPGVQRIAMVRRVNTEMGASLLRYIDEQGGKEWVDLRERSYKVLRNMAGIAAGIAAATDIGRTGTRAILRVEAASIGTAILTIAGTGVIKALTVA